MPQSRERELPQVLDLQTTASLGLSATPERPYDDGLESVLIPAIGPVIFTYDLRTPLEDGVIVPFTLHTSCSIWKKNVRLNTTN